MTTIDNLYLYVKVKRPELNHFGYLRKEQERVTQVMTQTEQGLNVTSYRVPEIEKVCDFAVELCRDCLVAYGKAKPHVKTMFNRVIFEKYT